MNKILKGCVASIFIFTLLTGCSYSKPIQFKRDFMNLEFGDTTFATVNSCIE